MKCLHLLLALLLLQALIAPGAAACDPPAVTPWFVERVEVGEAQLPEGVTVRSPDQQRIIIENTTPAELYLLSEPDDYPHVYPLLEVELPDGLFPTYKLLDGKFFEWDERLDDDASEIWEWQEGAGSHPELRVTQNMLTGIHFQLSLDQRNLNGDHRPDDAPLPLSQQTRLLLVYDGHLISVPLTISYELNPHYDPRSVEKAAAFSGCAMGALPFPLGFVAPLIFFAVLIIMMIWWKRRG